MKILFYMLIWNIFVNCMEKKAFSSWYGWWIKSKILYAL